MDIAFFVTFNSVREKQQVLGYWTGVQQLRYLNFRSASAVSDGYPETLLQMKLPINSVSEKEYIQE